MSDTIGLVIPAYDPDVSRLDSYLESVRDVLAPDRIRIELDAPSSPAVVDSLSRRGVTVNAVDGRRGKGAAITCGFEHLDTDVLAFADADGSTPPASLDDVVCGLAEGDLSVGSRRHPDADLVRSQSLLRQSMGDVFARCARHLLDVDLYDFQCGAKAMTSEAWRRISDHVHEPGFAWDLEVVGMAKAHGFEIVEVPITWVDRPESTVDPMGTALELGTTLLAVHHRMGVVAGNPTHEFISRLERHVGQ